MVRPDLTRVRLELARAHYAAGQDDKARASLPAVPRRQPALFGRERRRGFSEGHRCAQAMVCARLAGPPARDQRRPPHRPAGRGDRRRHVPPSTRTRERHRASARSSRPARRSSPPSAPTCADSSLSPPRPSSTSARHGTTSRSSARPASPGCSTAAAPPAACRRAGGGRAPRGFSTAWGHGQASRSGFPAACRSARPRTWTIARTTRGTIWTDGASRWARSCATRWTAGRCWRPVLSSRPSPRAKITGPAVLWASAIGMSRAFENGLSASVSASFQRQRYGAVDPLFAVRREDETAWLSA